MAFRLYIVNLALLLGACGTVVGNPKQPSGPSSPSTPTTSAIVYTLPTLNFTLPSAATADDAALALIDPAEDFGDSDRGVLTGWGQRINKLTTEIDNVTNRVNTLVAKQRQNGNETDPLVFSNQGASNALGGRMAALPAGTDYDYEAVLCYSGQVFTDFKWSKDGSHMDLVRDFSVNADGVVSTYPVKTHLTVVKSDSVALTFNTQGTWQESELAGSGSNLTEYSEVHQLASNELQVQLVEQHAAALVTNGTYAADAYLVGRLVPGTTNASYTTEFAAYFAGAPACKNGFDETATDLWHPAALTEPHFCIGRPFDGTQFSSITDYYNALADLKTVGIASEKQLEAVDFAAGASCD